MVYLAVGNTELFIESNYDGHLKAWRWYWYSRGIHIKTNGQRFDARGNSISKDKTLEYAAREYGR